MMVLCVINLISCNSKVKKGVVIVEFSHVLGEQYLELGKTYTTGTAHQQVGFNKIKYLLTDFKLVNIQGDTLSIPEKNDYFLGDVSHNTMKKSLSFPIGTYNTLLFNYGIDYAEDLKDEDNNGVLTDILDFTSDKTKRDMYWDWATAYRFLNIEGKYSKKEGKSQMPLKIHNGSHFGTTSHKEKIIWKQKAVQVTYPKDVEGRVLAHRTVAVSLKNIEVTEQESIKLKMKLQMEHFFDKNTIFDTKFPPNSDGIIVTVSPKNTPIVADCFVSVFELNQ